MSTKNFEAGVQETAYVMALLGAIVAAAGLLILVEVVVFLDFSFLLLALRCLCAGLVLLLGGYGLYYFKSSITVKLCKHHERGQ